MNKKTISLAVLLLTVVCLFYFQAYAAETKIKVIIRGENLTMDSTPLIESGRTLVPLRAIFESLDAYVEWDGKTKTISAIKGGTSIKLKIGDNTAYLNDAPNTLDVPAKIVKGRTLVPLRFISEALGAEVDWNDAKRTVTVSYDGSQEKKYNSTGNITNGGFVTAKDGYTYISLYNGGTWKIKDGSNEKTKVCDTSINFVNIVDDWVYFSNSTAYPVESEQKRLYKMRLDGKLLTKVSANPAEYVNIVGDWIYYVNTDDFNTPYKVRLDGKGEQQISDVSVNYLVVDDGWIYFERDSDGTLCKMRTSGTDIKVLDEDEYEYGEINKIGERIYFTTSKDKPGIYSINKDGTDKKQIAGGNVYSMNYSGGLIYYNDAKYNLYTVKEDGSDRKKLAAGIKGSLLADNGWIYYKEYTSDYLKDKVIGKDYRIKTDGSVKQRLDTEGLLVDMVISPTDSVVSPMPIVLPSEAPHTTVLSTKEIANNKKNAVVFIETYGEEKSKIASGSGFNIDASGIVVTNFHVINGALSIKCTLGTTVYDVDYVLNYNPMKDIAILKLKNASDLPVVSLGDSDKIELAEDVVAIGNPLELQNTVSTGIVSGLRVTFGINYIQTTASISPGSSGGPLFNSYGEVIGVTSMTLLGAQNINFAIPINSVKNLFASAACIPLSVTSSYEEEVEEYEPNNTMQTAGEFTPGQALTGEFDDKDDIDYYTFSLSGAGKITLIGAYDSLLDNADAPQLNMTLYDANGKELYRSSESKEMEYAVQRISEDLAPGTYYVSVKFTGEGDELLDYSDYGIISVVD